MLFISHPSTINVFCVKEWGAKLKKKKKRETRLYVGEIFMCQTVVTLRE